MIVSRLGSLGSLHSVDQRTCDDRRERLHVVWIAECANTRDAAVIFDRMSLGLVQVDDDVGSFANRQGT